MNQATTTKKPDEQAAVGHKAAATATLTDGKTITLTVDQLNAMIQQRVAEQLAVANQSVTTGPPTKPVKPGTAVRADTEPPNGMQVVAFFTRSGAIAGYELWPLPPADSDPDIRRKVLNAVDEAFARTLPTPDQPNRRAERMFVTSKWRKLFQHVPSWGDGCPVIMDDNQFPEDKRSQPGFRFEVAGEVARGE